MRRPDLEADCTKCSSLCCVAIYFEASEDFAYTKGAGEPCRNLQADGRCGIHRDLAGRGFAGCAQFDCYGAGPHATLIAEGEERQAVFGVLCKIHDQIWTLSEALKLCPSEALRAELKVQLAVWDQLASGSAAEILALDLKAHRTATQAVLRRLGEALGGRRFNETARGLRH